MYLAPSMFASYVILEAESSGFFYLSCNCKHDLYFDIVLYFCEILIFAVTDVCFRHTHHTILVNSGLLLTFNVLS